MGDLDEAVGTAVEGGLIGRAVSAERGEPGVRADLSADGHFAEAACLNCSTALIGPHCHQCGQQAHVHRTIGAFMHDLLHGALHFEGKIWRTLPLLAVKPGQLARRYIEGERARFVSPMALFLFSVFLMFAVFQFAGLSLANLDVDNPRAVWDVGTARADLDVELAAARAERAEVSRRIAAAASQPNQEGPLTDLEQEAASLDQRIANSEAGQASLAAVGGTPEAARKAITSSVNTGWDRLDYGLKKIIANPGLALYKLQTNFYKFSWLLIPISIPFVWLLFAWKRRFKGYDHAVFVTYSLAFMSLLIIALTVLGLLGVPAAIPVLLACIIAPIHIYKQLRGAYGLSRFSAFWRLTALLVFINFILVLFLQALVLLGLF